MTNEKLFEKMKNHLRESHALFKQWKLERSNWKQDKTVIKQALEAVLTQDKSVYLPLVKKALKELK